MKGVPTSDETARHIIELVSELTRVSVPELVGERGTWKVSAARGMAMHLIRTHTNLTLADTARLFNRADHGTVRHAVVSAKGAIDVYPQSRKLAEEVVGRLLNGRSLGMTSIKPNQFKAGGMPATLPALAGEQCMLNHTKDVDRPSGQISKALSIRQPWAWLIVNGYKDVENRSRRTHFRGRILVHAGNTMTRADYDACVLFMFIISQPSGILPPLPEFEELKAQRGGFVGEVDIVDCVAWSDSPWFTGDFGWVLDRPKAFELRPAPGTLGVFNVK